MREYVKQLLSGSEKWRAMKMVILGNGRIGKTTLLDAFEHLLLPGHELQVCNFSLKLANGRPKTRYHDELWWR